MPGYFEKAAIQEIEQVPWLSGGGGYAGPRGRMLDKEAGLLAAGAQMAWLDQAPDDALPGVGSNFGLPQFPGESTDSYRARLSIAWITREWAGTEVGILLSLTAYASADATVIPTVLQGRQDLTAYTYPLTPDVTFSILPCTAVPAGLSVTLTATVASPAELVAQFNAAIRATGTIGVYPQLDAGNRIQLVGPDGSTLIAGATLGGPSLGFARGDRIDGWIPGTPWDIAVVGDSEGHFSCHPGKHSAFWVILGPSMPFRRHRTPFATGLGTTAGSTATVSQVQTIVRQILFWKSPPSYPVSVILRFPGGGFCTGIGGTASGGPPGSMSTGKGGGRWNIGKLFPRKTPFSTGFYFNH